MTRLWEISLILILLLYTEITEIMGQVEKLAVHLHSTAELPCNYSSCTEGNTDIQWYRSGNSDVFIKEDKAVAWWFQGEPGSSQGFGIEEDFSLIIYNATLTDQGLYRCYVDGAAESTHDVTLDIYANPYSAQKIEYFPQTREMNVTCSMSRVFPLTFPKLTSYLATDTKQTEERNYDGTYNTRVSRVFPLTDNDTDVQCLYSNANFKSMTSVTVLITDYTDQPVINDRVSRNCSNSNLKTRCTLSGLWMVCLVLLLEVVILILVIIYLIKTGATDLLQATRDETENIDIDNGTDGQPVNGTENENVKTRAIHSDTFVFGGKLFSLVIKWIMLTIQVVVIILLSIYLIIISTKQREMN